VRPDQNPLTGPTSALVAYMTGTGNSRLVATWLADGLTGIGYTVEIAPIEAIDPLGRATTIELLCLVFPTYAFITPWHMLRFIAKLPCGKGRNACVLATRGGFKIGKLFLPGLAGTSFYLPALLLWLLGYRVRWLTGIDMPSNWMSVHPGLSEAKHRAIGQRAQAMVEKVIQCVSSGERYWVTAGNIFELIMGIWLLHISCVYLVLGRFYFGKLWFASSHCNSCGLCAEHCPVGAIRMLGSPARPYWRYTCESCMRCMAFCPTKAVEVSHSWVIGVTFVSSLPIPFIVASFVAGDTEGALYLWIFRAMGIVYTYAAIMISYLLLYLITRARVFNVVFTHTTLTHLWRRAHAPDTLLKDLPGRAQIRAAVDSRLK
jgi:Pyruvate/2-oxoacid:ferredoxin oxidoreductase delta subunit